MFQWSHDMKVTELVNVVDVAVAVVVVNDVFKLFCFQRTSRLKKLKRMVRLGNVTILETLTKRSHWLEFETFGGSMRKKVRNREREREREREGGK